MRLRRQPGRLRAQDGFTLIELLMAMVIGLLIVFAGLSLLDNSLKLSRRTDQRVDATQRGRLALDSVTRELRSQVCMSNTIPAIVSGDGSQVTYYVNLGAPGSNPEKHQISLESGNLILRRWVGAGAPPSMTFPTGATSTRTLLENVQALNGTTPVFRYFQFGTTTPVTPNQQLAVPLSAADLDMPVKIAVGFRVRPGADFRNQGSSEAVDAELQDSVYVRTSDPTDPTKGPRCN